MVRRKMRKTTPWKAALATLMCALVLFCSPLTAYAAEGEATALSLNSGNPTENAAFQVKNMLPGDSQQVTYRLKVSYQGTIQVCYKAIVREGGELLARGLNIKVTTADASKVLYNGALAEMPVLIQSLTASAAKTEELVYNVTIGMDTGAGNEYQNLSAVIDFEWWEGDPGVALLNLSENQAEQTSEMQLAAMAPNTSYSTTYQLDVSYAGEVAVSCAANVADAKLAESLNVKVTTADQTNVVYEGLLSEMPVLMRELSSDSETTEVLTYAVTVTLVNGADAQYQNKDAAVGFVWQVGEVKENPDEPGPSGGEEPGPGDEDPDPTTGEPDPTGSLVDPSEDPGDGNGWILPVVIVVVVLGVAAVVIVLLRKKGPKGPKGAVTSILVLTVLVTGLGISTVAYSALQQNVGGSLFQTATIHMDLNGGQPIFNDPVILEPGMQFQKEFTVTNEGTVDVYYRIKIIADDADLAAVMLVEIRKGDEVLFTGTMQELGENGTKNSDPMSPGETEQLTLVLKLSEAAGNNVQNKNVGFDVNLQAVQVANNPLGLFD